MESFVPAIQEELRRKNYPLHRAAELTQITFGPELKSAVVKRWLFISKNARTAVSISNNSVVLETTDYDTFDSFADRLAEVLEVVGRIAAVNIVDRLGLRFVDRIQPLSGENLSDYLEQPLRGFTPASLSVSDIFQRHEYFCKTPQGMLMIRVFQPEDGVFLPPGLDPSDLEPRFPAASGRVTILDIDHFSEAQMDFASDPIVDAMWALHEHCDIAFRAATTETARVSKWGAEAVVGD
jgi:uncharacterized protein (TIGR04255 family)